MRQFEIIQEEYQNWLDNLVAHAHVRDAAITINQMDFVNAKVLDRSQAGIESFDDHVEWIEDKAPALFALLQRYVRHRQNRADFQLYKDSSIFVSPSPVSNCHLSK